MREADAYISKNPSAGAKIREKAAEYRKLRNEAALNLSKEVASSFVKPTLAAVKAAKFSPKVAMAMGLFTLAKEETFGFIDILGKPEMEPIPPPSEVDASDVRPGHNPPSDEGRDYTGLDPVHMPGGVSGGGMVAAAEGPKPASSTLGAQSPYRGVGYALAHVALPDRSLDLAEKSPTPLHDTVWEIVRELERRNPGLTPTAYYVAGSVLELDIHHRAHSLGAALVNAGQKT